MWYYELNRQAFGPVSQETIAEELRAGKIQSNTLVWREGWPQWKPLGETELAALAGLPVSRAASLPPSPPAMINTAQPKKIKLDSFTRLFWWWFGLNLSVLPFLIISTLSRNQTWAMGLLCVFELPVVAGTVLQYILIYRLWQMIQDGFARTTPGKAVGFMFIPLFSFYWLFVVYFGLARDQKAYIERHFDNSYTSSIRKPHPGIALASVISSWAFLIFYFIFIIVVLSHSFMAQITPMELTNALTPNYLVTLIFSFLQFGLMVVMFFDFFLTAKSILKAESV